MSTAVGLGAFEGQKYLSLESYRANGTGVRTPVWFAAAPTGSPGATTPTLPTLPTLYVYATADSGKAKRIRRSGAIKIAPCDARGNVTGPWAQAHAEIVTGDEFARGMRLINRKYCPWKQILDLVVRLFPRHPRIVLAIRAVGSGSE